MLDTQAICNELVEAVRVPLDKLYSKHLPSGSESAVDRSRLAVALKSILITALYKVADQVTVELKEAEANYKIELDQCKSIASTYRPHPSLPLEIIQSIVSLSYKSEPCKGVGDLIYHKKEMTCIHLFSTTTLENWMREDLNKFLEWTSPFSVHFSIHEKDCRIPDTLRHASRWKTLEIRGPPKFILQQLAVCKSALFHIQNLVLADKDIEHRRDDNKKISEILQNSDAPNLQSLAVSLRYLGGLVSSGLLTNIIDLDLAIYVDSTGFSFSQYITSISQLQKLVSLSLEEKSYYFHSEPFFSDADNYRNLVTSIKSLQLKNFQWETAEKIIPWFSSCGLDRFSTTGKVDICRSDRSHAFISILSSTFPHLQQLKINYTKNEPHKLLATPPQIGDEETCKFVNIHTFDMSDIALSAKELYSLIRALRSRATPEAHSAGIVPINHLTITHWKSGILRDDQNVLFKYELGQLVPNLVVMRPHCYDGTDRLPY